MHTFDVIQPTLNELLASTAKHVVTQREDSGPAKFLAVAAAIVASTAPKDAPSRLPAAAPSIVSQPLDERALDLYVNLLKMRGIKIHSFSRLSAVRDRDGSVIIAAESGAINFKGPLFSLPSQKKFDWSGIAVTIEMTVHSDIIFRNPRGIYGSLKDQASTRILLTSETNGELVMRSLDKDPITGNPLPLHGQRLVSNGVETRLCTSAHELRIGLDEIHSVRQVEHFAQPSCVVLNNTFFSDVVRIQHTPTIGMIRIEQRNPLTGAAQAQHLKL